MTFFIGNMSFCHAVRPLFTEDCWVTRYGKPVIEIGGLVLTRRDNTEVKELITSLKYGFSPNIDVSIDLPYITHYSPEGNYDGLSDGTFKVKYNFYNNGLDAGACFLLGYQVDTASDPDYSATYNQHDITAMLIYSRDIGVLNYHLNFGYTFDDEKTGQPQNDYIIYNASVIKPLTDIVNVLGEVQYSRNTDTGDIIGETAVGFNYKFSDALIFDIAVGCGLNENSSSSNLAFGTTVLFN